MTLNPSRIAIDDERPIYNHQSIICNRLLVIVDESIVTNQDSIGDCRLPGGIHGGQSIIPGTPMAGQWQSPSGSGSVKVLGVGFLARSYQLISRIDDAWSCFERARLCWSLVILSFWDRNRLWRRVMMPTQIPRCPWYATACAQTECRTCNKSCVPPNSTRGGTQDALHGPTSFLTRLVSSKCWLHYGQWEWRQLYHYRYLRTPSYTYLAFPKPYSHMERVSLIKVSTLCGQPDHHKLCWLGPSEIQASTVLRSPTPTTTQNQ